MVHRFIKNHVKTESHLIKGQVLMPMEIIIEVVLGKLMLPEEVVMAHGIEHWKGHSLVAKRNTNRWDCKRSCLPNRRSQIYLLQGCQLSPLGRTTEF